MNRSVLVRAAAWIALAGVILPMQSVDAAGRRPFLFEDEPIPPGEPLPTVTVVGDPVPDPPTPGGPPDTSGGGYYVGRGDHSEFRRNRGDRQTVADASKGDPCDENGSNLQSGNPVVLSTGNKIETEVDFTSAGEMPLTLTRTYNHHWRYSGIFGKHWISNLDYSITIAPDESTIHAQRPDGRRIRFNRDPFNSNKWNEDKPNPIAYILRSGGNYAYSTEDNYNEVYDGEGRILRRTNINGISWRFEYENRYLTRVTHSSGRLNGSPLDRSMSLAWVDTMLLVIAPDGSTFAYQFEPNAFGPGTRRLMQAQITGDIGNPVVTIKYHYEDARFPGALTGKSIDNKRYSTFAYDAYARATDSKHAGPTPGTYVDAFHFEYSGTPISPPPGGPADPPPPGVPCNPVTHQCPANPIAPASPAAAAEDALVSMLTPVTNTVTETNPLGYKTTYTFVNGLLMSTSSQASAHCGARSSSRTYDAYGYEDRVTDFNGNVTDYNYAPNGQLSLVTEGWGSTVARTTSYTWDALRNRPLTETISGLRQTTYVYSPENRIASVTIKNLAPYGVTNQARAWTYKYTRWGVTGTLKTTVADGPLPGDTVITSYSEDGDVLAIASPTGTTTYSGYNGMGVPTHVVGENGEVIDYAWYPGGVLKSVTTYPNGVTPATTTYTYASGLLSTVTTPDGITTSFTYDNARRLVSTSRPVIGGTATRTLTYDASSNVIRIDESLAGGLRYRSYIDYDELDRVRGRRGNNQQSYQYTYDANGNLKTVTDSYAKTMTYTYDALGRLATSTDPLQGVATFKYDAADRLMSVKDPRGVVTTYQRDGFGQLWKEISPDRGTTAYYYLANGLPDTMTRGNGVQTIYHFDGLGRLTSLTAGGQSQTFSYDLCTNGVGRLCSGHRARHDAELHLRT